jgi:cytoskeleton protein RodZ
VLTVPGLAQSEKIANLNKADPYGDMTPASGLVSGDHPASAEPKARAEEPVQADSIGAFLCATRMRAGGDLQEIAKILCIRYGYLVAIEDGRHEDLPGSAYSVGFVRAYADYLGLDGNEVVRRLREETDGTVKTARFEFPMPSGESGLPNGGLLAIAMVLGMVVYGSWYTMTNADRDAVDLIQEVPGRLAVLIQDENTGPTDLESNEPQGAGASDASSSEATIAADSIVENAPVSESVSAAEQQAVAAVGEAMEQVPTDDVSQTPVLPASEDEPAVPEPAIEVATVVPETEPVEPPARGVERQEEPDIVQTDATSEEEVDIYEVASPESVAMEVAVVAEVAAVEVEQPVNTEEPVARVAENSVEADVENEQIEGASVVVPVSKPEEPLVIELRAKSDSWIQVRDGNELLLTRLLREGEVYQVPDRQGLTLMTGNAGGLEVFVDGELMPPLGDVGVVRRGVPLSAERLRSGVAPS